MMFYGITDDKGTYRVINPIHIRQYYCKPNYKEHYWLLCIELDNGDFICSNIDIDELNNASGNDFCPECMDDVHTDDIFYYSIDRIEE